MSFAITTNKPFFIRSRFSLKDLFLKTEGGDPEPPKGEEVPGWAKKLQETLEGLVPKAPTEPPEEPVQVPTPPAPATVEEEDDPPKMENPIKKFLGWLV